jgi:hypothetical protein
MPNARILVVLTVLLSVLCGMAARAEEALPSQVGRISAVNGAVSLRPASGEWTTASINDPLATGMAVRTADRARAGIASARCACWQAAARPTSRRRCDGSIALKQGRIGIHLARLEAGTAIEIDLPQGAVWLLAPGDYDIGAATSKRRAGPQFAGQARFAGGGADRTLAAGSALVEFQGMARAQSMPMISSRHGGRRPASRIRRR